MVRRKPTRHRVFAGALGCTSPQLVVTCVTLTLVCALFVVSRRHSSSPEQALQRGVGTHGAEATLGMLEMSLQMTAAGRRSKGLLWLQVTRYSFYRATRT